MMKATVRREPTICYVNRINVFAMLIGRRTEADEGRTKDVAGVIVKKHCTMLSSSVFITDANVHRVAVRGACKIRIYPCNLKVLTDAGQSFAASTASPKTADRLQSFKLAGFFRSILTRFSDAPSFQSRQ
jgi:hypothetical protein